MFFGYGYLDVLAIAFCMGFFVNGARMDMRSPLLWGSLSLATWLVFTQLCMGGLGGGFLSQGLLYAGLTGWEMRRERIQITEARRTNR